MDPHSFDASTQYLIERVRDQLSWQIRDSVVKRVVDKYVGPAIEQFIDKLVEKAIAEAISNIIDAAILMNDSVPQRAIIRSTIDLQSSIVFTMERAFEDPRLSQVLTPLQTEVLHAARIQDHAPMSSWGEYIAEVIGRCMNRSLLQLPQRVADAFDIAVAESQVCD
jgi:hypothetical protein